MGLSFRKSIKIGKNTRINFSKTGGIGISTGVKGARISMNQKGVRTTIGKGGLRYTKNYDWDSNKEIIPKEKKPDLIDRTTDNILDKIKKYRECPIDNKEDKIHLPKIIWRELAITGLLAISSIFLLPMVVFVLISAIVILFTLLLNKQCWAQTYQVNAIKAYCFKDNEKCIYYCEKSLKKKDYESTRRLLELVKQESLKE